MPVLLRNQNEKYFNSEILKNEKLKAQKSVASTSLSLCFHFLDDLIFQLSNFLIGVKCNCTNKNYHFPASKFQILTETTMCYVQSKPERKVEEFGQSQNSVFRLLKAFGIRAAKD